MNELEKEILRMDIEIKKAMQRGDVDTVTRLNMRRVEMEKKLKILLRQMAQLNEGRQVGGLSRLTKG